MFEAVWLDFYYILKKKVKYNLLSDVLATDSYHNYFSISHSSWRIIWLRNDH